MTPCSLCSVEGTLRTLTRYYERVGNVDLCRECCLALNLDTVTDWPESSLFMRFDRWPFRSQDYR